MRSKLRNLFSSFIAFAFAVAIVARDYLGFLFDWLIGSGNMNHQQLQYKVKQLANVQSLFKRNIYKEQDFIFC